ncbi:MAG: sulfurtransferase TusA family protein [Nitrospiraceae bacterium]
MTPIQTQPAPITTEPIPQAILEEIEAFESEARRVADGDLSNDLFKPFRLQHGIYGQRQPGVQMFRIKVPFGGVTGNQLRRVAELADQYATGVAHVTTRQDIQLHYVQLKDVGTMMRGLAEVGLTTREACANTVRNVTACHLAGVCQGEVFDITPYAKTIAYHLLRNPLNQSMPRKFKIAFSGCAHDCALTPIHDIGLLAARHPSGTLGFKMVVGGGLGSTPRLAQVLREFVPMPLLIPSIEAVIKVFDTLGNRKNRNKARMKFVIDKLGFPEFAVRWEAAYRALGYGDPPAQQFAAPGQAANGHGGLTLLAFNDPPTPLIMPTRAGAAANGNGNGNGAHGANGSSALPSGVNAADYEAWARTNVLKQKQPGYASVFVKLPMGDLTVSQLYVMADLAEQFSNGNLRTTISQNFIIRWIPETRLPELYGRLKAAGLGEPGAELIEDIVACPGTDTCGLGITSSKGVARALADVFPPGQVPDDLRGASIKVSGCHNSCAQHHIATIGLHGVGKRIGDHTAPHYEVHIGGGVNGKATIGQLVVKVPAKNVPAAMRHLVDVFRRDRREQETLPAFIQRVGKSVLKDELIAYTIFPSFAEDPTYYYDWEGEKEFVLEDLGPGECAGGALELIDNQILEADQELYQAKLAVEKHQYPIAVNKAYRAVLAGVKALLVTEGIEPSTDAETFQEFEQRLAGRGVVPATYSNLAAQCNDLGTKDATAEFVQKSMSFAKGFVEACRTATESMDKNLKLKSLPVDEPIVAPAPAAPEASPVPAAPVYDLRGVACPMNYVKTKLKLEMMDAGERLEVWLDAGEPITNVPMSLKNDGHLVLLQEALEPEAAHYKILVEKVEG